MNKNEQDEDGRRERKIVMTNLLRKKLLKKGITGLQTLTITLFK